MAYSMHVHSFTQSVVNPKCNSVCQISSSSLNTCVAHWIVIGVPGSCSATEFTTHHMDQNIGLSIFPNMLMLLFTCQT